MFVDARYRPIVDIELEHYPNDVGGWGRFMNWLKRGWRRVRVKSIIQASYRRPEGQWERWLRWEIAKSFFPALVAVPFGALLRGIPGAVWVALLILCLSHAAFTLVNAGIAVRRLNRRRSAYFEAAGYDLTFTSLLRDREAWKNSLARGSMRDFLRTRGRKLDPRSGG